MCIDPGSLALGSFALQAGSSVLGYAGQSKAAKAQAAYDQAVYQNDLAYRQALIEKQQEDARRQEEFVKRASEAITTNYYGRIADLTQRNIEEMIAAQVKQFDLSREAEGERKSLAVKLGEGGFDGHTVDAILNDIDRQRGEASSSIDQNLHMVQRQLGRAVLATRADAESQLNGIPIRGFDPIPNVNPPPIRQQPSLFSALGGVVSAGIGALDRYSKWSGVSVGNVLQRFRI